MLLMINNEFPPTGGGNATVNLRLFEQWTKYFKDPILLVTSKNSEWTTSAAFSETIQIHPLSHTAVKNIHHSTVIDLLKFLFRSSWFVFFQMKMRPTVVFGWSTVPAGFTAVLFGKLKKIRSVVFVSGPEIPGFEDRYRYLYPMIKSILRYIWNTADVVIAKCTYEVEEIRKLCPKANLVMVPIGTTVQEMPVPFNHLPPDGPLHLVCTARLIKRKGIDVLLKAIQLLQSRGRTLQVSIAGTGDEEAALKALSQSMNLDGIVRFLGYVDRESIRVLLRSAHVFVLPSYQEGMSVAALEALGFGLPLVLTNTGGAIDLVEENLNGYIIPSPNSELLADHIEKFISSPEKIRQFGAYSFKKAQNFEWSNIAQRYVQLMYPAES